MAAFEDDQGPYRGYQQRNFDTGNLPAPVRGQTPLTSTFDKPPVRGVAPVHSSTFDKPPVRGVAPVPRAPLTSEFDEPPVRGVAPVRATAPPVTSEFDEAPVRGVGAPVEATAPPLTSTFDQPPVRGVAPPATRGGAPKRLPMDDFDGAPPVRKEMGAGQSPIGSGETPIMDTLSGNRYGRALVVADVVLRSLTSLCLVIALALFARFLSDVNDDGTVSNVSPKYALIMTIIGVLYSLFKLASAIFHIAVGKPMLPTEVSHLISYIGDQVFMALFLTVGSVGASYLITINCSQSSSACGRGAGGVAMAFLAFAFIATSSVLSTFSFYKKRT